MFFTTIKSFLNILNADALVFLGTRLAGIILSITSVILLCRAVTLQPYFPTRDQGLMFDMIPLGPLAYSLAWSTISLILPGCQRKYHPLLDVVLDFFGWALSFGAGGAVLSWSIRDPYMFEDCSSAEAAAHCNEIEANLSSAEKSGAVLLILTGLTHLIMFVRACVAVNLRRKHYRPSRNSFMRFEKSRSEADAAA